MDNTAVSDTIRVMGKNVAFKLGPLRESTCFKSKLVHWARQ